MVGSGREVCPSCSLRYKCPAMDPDTGQFTEKPVIDIKDAGCGIVHRKRGSGDFLDKLAEGLSINTGGV